MRGEASLRQLLTIGFYMIVSRLLENLEVELEEANVEDLEVPRG